MKQHMEDLHISLNLNYMSKIKLCCSGSFVYELATYSMHDALLLLFIVVSGTRFWRPDYSTYLICALLCILSRKSRTLRSYCSCVLEGLGSSAVCCCGNC